MSRLMRKLLGREVKTETKEKPPSLEEIHDRRERAKSEMEMEFKFEVKPELAALRNRLADEKTRTTDIMDIHLKAIQNRMRRQREERILRTGMGRLHIGVDHGVDITPQSVPVVPPAHVCQAPPPP